MPRYLLSDLAYGDAEEKAVIEVLRSKWLSVGPQTEAFEQEFASLVGALHAVALSSCTAGLHLALLAHGIGPGDEVLVPSYTFVASANPILYVGAKPVFVDIVGDGDLNMDPEDVAAKITNRSRAMIVVHIAGFTADMDRLLALAERNNLVVVEDASHAPGAAHQSNRTVAGRAAGTLGHAGCFSFFANKNLPTGEGGMLVTHDAQIAERVKHARSHGMTKTSWDKASGRAMDYDVRALGFNYRCTELTAALGRVQLQGLTTRNGRRLELVKRYRRNLAAHDWLEPAFAARLEGSAHHLFAILLADAAVRPAFRDSLAAEGVQTSVHYPPVHEFSQYRERCPEAGALPNTVDAAAREVTLPLHPLLSDEDVDAICQLVSIAGNRVRAVAR